MSTPEGLVVFVVAPTKWGKARAQSHRAYPDSFGD